MLFTKENIGKIARDAKTESRRLKKPCVKSGRTYRIRNSYYDHEDRGRIMVVRTYRQRLGAITDRDEYREGCGTRRAFFEMFERINGPVHRNKTVWVVRFRCIG